MLLMPDKESVDVREALRLTPRGTVQDVHANKRPS